MEFITNMFTAKSIKDKNKKVNKKSTNNNKSTTTTSTSFVESQRQLGKRYNRDEKDLRTIRILVSIIILSGAIIISLVATLALLTPLKNPIPYLITAHDNQRVYVQVKPINRSSDVDKLSLENIARTHVSLRNEVIPIKEVMARRWNSKSTFRAITANDVYQNFKPTMSTVFSQINRLPYHRIVDIKSASSPDLINFTIIFETTEKADRVNTIPVVKQYKALVQLGRIPRGDNRTTNLQDRLKNPLAIEVKKYYQEEIKN